MSAGLPRPLFSSTVETGEAVSIAPPAGDMAPADLPIDLGPIDRDPFP
jgi:hypothetical protein